MSDDLSPAEAAREREYELTYRELAIEREVRLAEARADYASATSEAERIWAHDLSTRLTAIIFPDRGDAPPEPPLV